MEFIHLKSIHQTGYASIVTKDLNTIIGELTATARGTFQEHTMMHSSKKCSASPPNKDATYVQELGIMDNEPVATSTSMTKGQMCFVLFICLLAICAGIATPIALCAYCPFAEFIYNLHHPEGRITELSTTAALMPVVSSTPGYVGRNEVVQDSVLPTTTKRSSLQEQWKTVESAPRQKTTSFPLSTLATRQKSTDPPRVVNEPDRSESKLISQFNYSTISAQLGATERSPGKESIPVVRSIPQSIIQDELVQDSAFPTPSQGIASILSPEEQSNEAESGQEATFIPFPPSTSTKAASPLRAFRSFVKIDSELFPHLNYTSAVVDIVKELPLNVHDLQNFDDVYRNEDDLALTIWVTERTLNDPSFHGYNFCNQVFETRSSANASARYIASNMDDLMCKNEASMEFNTKIIQFRNKDAEASTSLEIIDFDNLETSSLTTETFYELKRSIMGNTDYVAFPVSLTTAEVRIDPLMTWSIVTAKENRASIGDLINELHKLGIKSIEIFIIEKYIIWDAQYQALHSFLTKGLFKVKHVVFQDCSFALDGFHDFNWVNLPANVEFIFEGGRMHPLVRHMWKLYKPVSKIMIFKGVEEWRPRIPLPDWLINTLDRVQ